MKKKQPLRLRTYEVVRRAVEEGITHGIRRAHKYAEVPTRDGLQDHIEREVLSALCDVVDFEDER